MKPMLCPVIVGRDEERQELASALRAAGGGAGGLWVLAGEAGIGKSRLVREVRADAQARGLRVLAGRGLQRSAPAALRPLEEALQAGFRDDEPPDDPRLRGFLPTLSRLLPGRSGSEPSGRKAVGPPLAAHDRESASDGIVTAEAVTRLLGALGRRGGCLLVLEDLHWADPQTLDVVEYLADHLADEPVVCLATVRTGEDSAAETRARLLAERRAARLLTLERLSDAATDRMLEACLDTTELPPELRRFVSARAEGVPLFVEELLAGLSAADSLQPTDDGWRVISRLVPAVPLTFAETVRRRMQGMHPSARHVLCAAAVIGRRFDWELLPATTGLAETDVVEALRAATGAQLLTAAGGVFSFRHALSRDVVLADLLPPERELLAVRALRALEAAHPDLERERLDLAVDLAERAAQPERAARLLLTGANRLLQRGAVSGAQAALDHARSLADDTALRLDIDEARAHAAALGGEVDRAVELAGRVLASAAPAEAADRSAALHLVLTRAAVVAGRWDVAQRHAEQALAYAGDKPALRVRAQALSAQVAIAHGRLADAEHLAGDAVAHGQAAGAPEAACEALEVLGRCARLQDVAAAEAHFERARAIAEVHDLRLWRARALHELGTIDLFTTQETGRLLAARDAAVEAGAIPTIAVVDLHLASVALASWRADDAVEPAQRSIDLSRRLRLATLGMALLHLACAHAAAGRPTPMEAGIDEALSAAGHDLDVVAGVPGRVRVYLALRRADFAAARRHLDEGFALLRRDPSLAHPFRGLWALLRTVEGVDDAAARAEASEAAGAGVPANRKLLAVAEGVAAARAGRLAEVEEPLALLWDGGWAARGAWKAILQRILAEPALAEGWGEPRAWLREALTTFDELAMDELASSCRAALRGAGEPVPRRGRGEHGVPAALRALSVTSREVDVLAVVAEGLTNREIGDRLSLSPRTVERHVASLLAKTGRSGRRDLVRLAAQVGLDP